ncbi:MarR family transcriptional regulator [Acidisoma cellulosilytica]|uniref:MarR family transcriptional regulator n=2 Tax=Acidisoma cellulosilyticum TaxID=2802395 RepID=A0A963YY63_9PROT|nr:MarR family transcriptional regulator [Acidisoma cellulosilyticum]MCB8878996.1 MarR family transcriptional regulator [Acidisoma cellulosilyticum]
MPPSAQSPSNAGAGLLFLREEELRLAQDMLFFAYRDFTHAADEVLDGLELGRAHHRALHFIARMPGMSVSDLLSILGITKQSLSRVLTTLIEQGYVVQAPGRVDRRQRLLSLTAKGAALERQLFERQRDLLLRAYRDAGSTAVEGFRRVLRALTDETGQAHLAAMEAAARELRARSA